MKRKQPDEGFTDHGLINTNKRSKLIWGIQYEVENTRKAQGDKENLGIKANKKSFKDAFKQISNLNKTTEKAKEEKVDTRILNFKESFLKNSRGKPFEKSDSKENTIPPKDNSVSVSD